MKLSKVTMTSALALAAAFSMVESASAQPGAVYGGGATFPSVVYRQLFDCFAIPVNPAIFPISPHCPSSTGAVVAPSFQFLYSTVGSGAGKRAFRNHNGSTSTSIGLGTPASSNTVPYTSSLLPAYGYPNFHFGASDDVLNASDITDYNAKGGPANFGNILQIPTLVGPITIAFNGLDGTGAPLNINPANYNPPGSSSQLNLSRQAYCGIFSGHITKWDNPILTALNGGVPLGSGQITVVHRSDGSGTTFLATNGLVAQCGYSILNGPNNETDATIVSYAFPWSDRTSTSLPNPPPVQGANLHNWPDLTNDQFGNPIPQPAGAVFSGQNGNSSVVLKIKTTNGAIGYASPDFVEPVVPGNPKTANLQNYNDIVNATGLFHAPTPANATTAMLGANYNMTLASMTDPLTWSTQGIAPDPVQADAYPLAGFTWMNLYQCYEPTNGALIGLTNYLQWHFTSPEAQAILNANGFAPIPLPWFNNAAVLAVVSDSRLGYPQITPQCLTQNLPGA